MKDPEQKNDQKPSSNASHSDPKPRGESAEQGTREREEERKTEEPTDLGQAAEESKRDTNA
jgi:hypothetical protein